MSTARLAPKNPNVNFLHKEPLASQENATVRANQTMNTTGMVQIVLQLKFLIRLARAPRSAKRLHRIHNVLMANVFALVLLQMRLIGMELNVLSQMNTGSRAPPIPNVK
jgi:hypothetical protein